MGPPNASFPGTSQWLLNLGPSSSSTSRPTFALSSLQFPLWRHCECSSTPVLHRPQRLATFPGPDHSQNAKFAASCVHGLLCRSFDEAACMRRSQTPPATKLGTKLRCAQISIHILIIRVAEVPAKNMPSLTHASTSPEQQLSFLQQTGKNPYSVSKSPSIYLLHQSTITYWT
jgi:hypothetical protein